MRKISKIGRKNSQDEWDNGNSNSVNFNKTETLTIEVEETFQSKKKKTQSNDELYDRQTNGWMDGLLAG